MIASHQEIIDFKYFDRNGAAPSIGEEVEIGINKILFAMLILHKWLNGAVKFWDF